MHFRSDNVIREFKSKSGKLIKIRHFRRKDLEGIWGNFNEVVEQQIFLPVFTKVLSDYEMESWYDSITYNNEVCLVAIDETNNSPNDVVGQVTLENDPWDAAGHVAVLGIIVATNYRFEGIGRELMKCSHEIAKGRGKKKVVLSVLSTNVNAYELYKALGYKEVGKKHKQFYMNEQYIDEIIMELWLDD